VCGPPQTEVQVYEVELEGLEITPPFSGSRCHENKGKLELYCEGSKVTLASSFPEHCPEAVGLTMKLRDTSGTASVTVATAWAVKPVASVAANKYVPKDKPVNTGEEVQSPETALLVESPRKEYLYGGRPPVTPNVTEPVELHVGTISIAASVKGAATGMLFLIHSQPYLSTIVIL